MAMPGPDDIQRDRDRRIRRSMLRVLLYSRRSPKGGLGGEALRDAVDGAGRDTGDVCDDESHALALIRSLCAKGMVQEVFLPQRRSVRFGLQSLFFKLLDQGERLLNETEPPDPDIADDRIVSDQD